MNISKEGRVSAAQKPRKDFQIIKQTSGKDFIRLNAIETWNQIAIPRVPETGYPVIGADIRGILTQYSSRSVVSAVEGTHRNRQGLNSPHIKTMRWLLELEKRPLEQQQVADLAASLATQVNIPTGGTVEGESREIFRRKLFFELFKKMLIDLREVDIQTLARDGNEYAEHSIGYHEATREIDAATDHPKDMSQNIGDELVSGNEERQNPTERRKQIGQNMLSANDIVQPPTSAFLGRHDAESDFLESKEKDRLAGDQVDRKEDEVVNNLINEVNDEDVEGDEGDEGDEGNEEGSVQATKRAKMETYENEPEQGFEEEPEQGSEEPEQGFDSFQGNEETGVSLEETKKLIKKYFLRERKYQRQQTEFRELQREVDILEGLLDSFFAVKRH